jgi:hypothetical protein
MKGLVGLVFGLVLLICLANCGRQTPPEVKEGMVMRNAAAVQNEKNADALLDMVLDAYKRAEMARLEAAREADIAKAAELAKANPVTFEETAKFFDKLKFSYEFGVAKINERVAKVQALRTAAKTNLNIQMRLQDIIDEYYQAPMITGKDVEPIINALMVEVKKGVVK